MNTIFSPKFMFLIQAKNSLGLSVNLSEFKGLGSPGRVMKKKKKELINKILFKGILLFSD